MAVLRASHLRTEEARTAAWQQLRDWIRDALIWAPLLEQRVGAPEAAVAEA